MGFFKIDSFESTYDWSINTVTGSFVDLSENTFEETQEESKKSTLQILFDTQYKFEPFTISKNYYNPIFFKFKDVYNKDVLYDTLRITYSAQGINNTIIKKPEDFLFSIGIKYKSKLLREWYFPISNSCDYTYCDFDLQPLHKDYLAFDEIFITFIKQPGKALIKLGSAYLVQDFDELHNIKLALADLLHLKNNKFVTKLYEQIKPGDRSIKVIGSSDIFKGSSLLFKDSDISEVHVVKDVDALSEDVYEINFMNEFDSDSVLYTWAANTEIQSTIPASIIEMRDAEAIFPLYFIYSEIFKDDIESTRSGNICDSYVRGEEECSVSVRKAWDAVSANITINIFSNVPETALEMWRFLKSVVTNRDELQVAGKSIQYVISGERDIGPEDSETLPNYIMDLTFYFRHNVYNRKYVRFPKYSKMALTYEIKPVEAIK